MRLIPSSIAFKIARLCARGLNRLIVGGLAVLAWSGGLMITIAVATALMAPVAERGDAERALMVGGVLVVGWLLVFALGAIAERVVKWADRGADRALRAS